MPHTDKKRTVSLTLSELVIEKEKKNEIELSALTIESRVIIPNQFLYI